MLERLLRRHSLFRIISEHFHHQIVPFIVKQLFANFEFVSQIALRLGDWELNAPTDAWQLAIARPRVLVR